MIASVADLLPATPVIETVTVAVRGEVMKPVVLTVNVAEVEPAGMITVCGALAELPTLLLTVIVMLVPPVGAGPVSVTVAVEDSPALMDALLRVSVAAVAV